MDEGVEETREEKYKFKIEDYRKTPCIESSDLEERAREREAHEWMGIKREHKVKEKEGERRRKEQRGREQRDGETEPLAMRSRRSQE